MADGDDAKYGAQIGILESVLKPQIDPSAVGRERFSFISFLVVGFFFRFGSNCDVDTPGRAFLPPVGSSPALGPLNSWTGHDNCCSRLANRNRLISPGAARLCQSAQLTLSSERRSDSVFKIGWGESEACCKLGSFVLSLSSVQLDNIIWFPWAERLSSLDHRPTASSVRNESARSILHNVEERWSDETSKQINWISRLMFPWNLKHSVDGNYCSSYMISRD